MVEQNINEDAVRHVLVHYHTRYPAPPRRGVDPPTDILIGDYSGRDLKVYIERGSNPWHVKTVRWRG